MGWIDHGAIWCCDLESRAETLIPVPGAQFVGVRGGRDGFFRVTHGESAGVVASVRHVSRPEEILSSVLLDATGPVLDGDMDVWRMVDRACVVKGLTGQKVLLVEYLLGEVKDIDLGWYNAETYDLGYQGLVDCLAVSGGKEVVVSVQRSSKLVDRIRIAAGGARRAKQARIAPDAYARCVRALVAALVDRDPAREPHRARAIW